MRILVVGATGVIGSLVTSLLREAGHEVSGTTRSQSKAELIELLGATPIVVDVYDAEALTAAVTDAAPDVIVHELTDLPDDVAEIAGSATANARIRRVGTRHLLDAAAAAGVERVLVESVAWTIPGDGGAAVAEMEQMTLDAGGVVLRYGQFYGPGTYHDDPPGQPHVSLPTAARRTVELLDAPSGIYTIVDDVDD